MRRVLSVVAWALLALSPLAIATAATAASNHSAPSPFFSGKAFHDESLLMPAGEMPAASIVLGPLDSEVVSSAKRSNAMGQMKPLHIGIGRKVPWEAEAGSAALKWVGVRGGLVAHWKITSTGATALRLEIAAARLSPQAEFRFAGAAVPGTVYGPFMASDVIANPTFWSPVLQGESAIAELFLPDGVSPLDVDLSIGRISHLFVNPADPDAEILAKIGESQSCEVDLICRSNTDAALASAGKAVARMTFSDGMGGGTFLCTGTLLNPTGGSFTPYFYSANHCISTQAYASTLTTHWFYDRTTCNTGGVSPSYVQLPGGATLRYASLTSDALLLQLNATPPAGAVFAGWDSATLGSGTALTGIHHPAGDVKKVSLATMGGFQPGVSSLITGSFIIANWNSTTTGVTEGGSSGSGIFSAVGSPATDYKFRGGLFGGPSSCTATGTSLRDFYSRFDLVYSSISQYLSPAPGTYNLAVSKSGIGTGTVTSSPAGINCGTSCSANFTSGATVNLTAVAAQGSTFSGWSGACSGTGGCMITMNSAKSVTASFTLPDDFPNDFTLAPLIATNGSVGGNLHIAGDLDWFRFDFPGPGTWTIYTTGTTDTVGAAYAPNGVTVYGSDDDSGTGTNFSLTFPIGAATSVFVKVSGYAGTATGAYTLVSTYSPTVFDAVTDLNADGKSDILWRNSSTGQLFRMLMNGFMRNGEALVYTEANLAWTIVADADFNGDGVTDLLWRNSNTGQVYLMPFGASGLPNGGVVIYTEPNAAWKIVHTPDFNDDGKADLLWWNSSTGQVYAMLMDGFTIGTQGLVYAEPNTAWRIVAVGDFAGSGKRNQLLWLNNSTGVVYLMTVNVSGGVFTQSGQVIYNSTPPYRVIAAADFNDDGRSDILWRKEDTGQVYLMLMNGPGIIGEGQIHHEPNLAWKIVAAGDYDGNGKADILWRNDVTGQVYMMLMNGMSIADQALIYQEANTAWKILGPWEYRLP